MTPVTPMTPTRPTTPHTRRRPPKLHAVTHVKATVLSKRGKTRRVLVSWQRVVGTRRYVVLRNGRKLASTTARTLVDASAPRGTLRYVVRVSG